MSEQGIQYYPDPVNEAWNRECEAIIPYLFGTGINVGSGGSAIFPKDVRIDINPEKKPNRVRTADDLPFVDGQFDYLYNMHLIEHLDDQIKAFNEWIRVVRPGGVIAIVHPEKNRDKYGPKTVNKQATHEWDKHKHERTKEEFLQFIKGFCRRSVVLFDYGDALSGLSFYVILKKKNKPTYI